MGHMRDAVQYGGEPYVLPTEHRPVVRFFDHMIHSNTCVTFPECLLYNMETDPSEAKASIYAVTAGGGGGGGGATLEVCWTPLAGPEDDGSGEIVDIDDPNDWLGKPFTCRCDIKIASGLSVNVSATYIRYNFFGESVVTETKEYEKGTRSPNYEFSYVHHIPKVTNEFIDFINTGLELQVFTTPYFFVPPSGISTNDPGVSARICKDAGVSKPALASHSMLKKSLVENVGDEPDVDGEKVSLKRELSRVKEEKRRLQCKSVILQIGHVAGGAGKAVAAMNTVDELRAEVARLQQQLVERGPAPPAGPPTGNPRNSGSAQLERIEKLEKRCEQLAQQIRDLGHVPLD